MSSSWVPIVVAAIALLGTLAGIVAAQRRWRRERQDSFRAERRAIYRQLWEQAEGANLGLRTGTLSAEEHQIEIQKLNLFMLRSGPFLDEADRVLAREYVEAVSGFVECVRDAGDADATAALGHTDAIPDDVLRRVRSLQAAQERALELRARVVERVRKVLASET